MTVPLSSSLTIQFDGINLKIEAPGTNGSRRKIDCGSINDQYNWEIIKQELISQIEAAKDRQRNELMALQRTNIEYVAREHNDVSLLARVWGKDWTESQTMRRRLAKAAGPGQFDPITQKIKPQETKINTTLNLFPNKE